MSAGMPAVKSGFDSNGLSSSCLGRHVLSRHGLGLVRVPGEPLQYRRRGCHGQSISMAPRKIKHRKSRGHEPDPAVRQRLDGLLHFYRVGTQSNRRHPGRVPQAVMEQEAQRCKLSPELVRKARQFAASYSHQEVIGLVAQCRRHNHALGRGHMIRLLTVPREQRNALQQLALEQRWGWLKLDDEILKRFGLRLRGGGRRRQVPAGAKDACYQIGRLCDQWRRLSRALRRPAGGQEEEDEQPFRQFVPEDVRKHVLKADGAMRVLGEVVQEKLGRQILG